MLDRRLVLHFAALRMDAPRSVPSPLMGVIFGNFLYGPVTRDSMAIGPWRDLQ